MSMEQRDDGTSRYRPCETSGRQETVAAEGDQIMVDQREHDCALEAAQAQRTLIANKWMALGGR